MVLHVVGCFLCTLVIQRRCKQATFFAAVLKSQSSRCGTYQVWRFNSLYFCERSKRPKIRSRRPKLQKVFSLARGSGGWTASVGVQDGQDTPVTDVQYPHACLRTAGRRAVYVVLHVDSFFFSQRFLLLALVLPEVSRSFPNCVCMERRYMPTRRSNTCSVA